MLYFLQSLAILYGAETGPEPTDRELACWMLAAGDHLPEWQRESVPPASELERKVALMARASLFARGEGRGRGARAGRARSGEGGRARDDGPGRAMHLRASRRANRTSDALRGPQERPTSVPASSAPGAAVVSSCGRLRGVAGCPARGQMGARGAAAGVPKGTGSGALPISGAGRLCCAHELGSGNRRAHRRRRGRGRPNTDHPTVRI